MTAAGEQNLAQRTNRVMATENVNQISFATNALPVLGLIVNHWHNIPVRNDVLEKHHKEKRTLAWRGVPWRFLFDDRAALTNVLLFNNSAVTGGSKERRESIAFGPLMATAGTSVCAPVIIAKPPPVALCR
jgi:hypothetical protein